MKKTEGYVTDDGTFFEREQEAALYEAEWRLRHKLGAEFLDVNQDKFFIVLLDAITEIGEYINAYNTAYPPKRADAEDAIGTENDESEPPEAVNGLGLVSNAEEDLASLLKLPARRPEHVSDVGRRTRSKKVSDGREKHGA